MSENSVVIKKDSPTTIWSMTLGLFGRIVGVLFFSMIMSIIIEWLMILFVREQSGSLYLPAKMMFEYELQFIDNYISRFENAAQSAPWLIKAQELMYISLRSIFIDSGALQFIHDFHTPKANDWEITLHFKKLIAVYADYLVAAVYILMMFLVRLTILLLSFPIFIVFGIVGFCDGLMQRDIRRWTAANESSFVYHIAKKLSMPTLILGMLIYLSSPWSIHPNLVLIPTAIAFGLILALMSSKFKKYL